MLDLVGPSQNDEDGDEQSLDERLWAGITEASLLVDTWGRVTAASPSAAQVYGSPPHLLRGRPAIGLFHPEDRVTVEAYVARPELAEGAEAFRARVAQGATWQVCVVRAIPVHDAVDVSLSLVARPDPSRPVEDDRCALEQLRLLDEAKHRLLEAVSHELRTPLTVLLGFAQTLQRRGLQLPEERLRALAGSAERQAQRLQRIVFDLIELDRAARGALVADAREVDLATVVLDVLDDVPLEGRLLHTRVEPVVVAADRARIERLLESLLTNVRRHTPHDTNVWVRLRPDGDGAVLEVIDDGPGIPEELHEDVFSPFIQGPDRDRVSPGMGLGLSLVRRVAELHGGRCWITTPHAGGTGVHVWLPQRRSQSTASARLADAMRHARAHAAAAATSSSEPEIRPEALGLVAPILRSVRQELGMDVAYLSAFTPEDQVVLAVDGDGEPMGITPGARYDLEDTYCVRMVRGEIGHVVPDARVEPAVADLPATLEGISSYVGVPVRLPDGHVFGSLCCAATERQEGLAPHDAAVLQAVARILGNQLAQRNVVTSDHGDVRDRVETLLRRPDGLRCLYQPIVELTTGEVVGVEALARFADSQVRPPDTWFADAARVGLGSELDQTALLRALSGLDHLPRGYLSVNVTPDTVIGGGLRPLLGRVPLERIVLEITEHAAVADYDRLRSALHPFRAAGARLAIDDVGSGFANLRHVLRTQPDIVKIDRSLVSNVTTDPVQEAIASALAHVAHNLGASIVAEGIEDGGTLDALRGAGITHGQGFLFARPGPLPLTSDTYPTG